MPVQSTWDDTARRFCAIAEMAPRRRPVPYNGHNETAALGRLKSPDVHNIIRYGCPCEAGGAVDSRRGAATPVRPMHYVESIGRAVRGVAGRRVLGGLLVGLGHRAEPAPAGGGAASGGPRRPGRRRAGPSPRRRLRLWASGGPLLRRPAGQGGTSGAAGAPRYRGQRSRRTGREYRGRRQRCPRGPAPALSVASALPSLSASAAAEVARLAEAVNSIRARTAARRCTCRRSLRSPRSATPTAWPRAAR